MLMKKQSNHHLCRRKILENKLTYTPNKLYNNPKGYQSIKYHLMRNTAAALDNSKNGSVHYMKMNTPDLHCHFMRIDMGSFLETYTNN